MLEEGKYFTDFQQHELTVSFHEELDEDNYPFPPIYDKEKGETFSVMLGPCARKSALMLEREVVNNIKCNNKNGGGGGSPPKYRWGCSVATTSVIILVPNSNSHSSSVSNGSRVVSAAGDMEDIGFTYGISSSRSSSHSSSNENKSNTSSDHITNYFNRTTTSYGATDDPNVGSSSASGSKRWAEKEAKSTDTTTEDAAEITEDMDIVYANKTAFAAGAGDKIMHRRRKKSTISLDLNVTRGYSTGTVPGTEAEALASAIANSLVTHNITAQDEADQINVAITKSELDEKSIRYD